VAAVFAGDGILKGYGGRVVLRGTDGEEVDCWEGLVLCGCGDGVGEC